MSVSNLKLYFKDSVCSKEEGGCTVLEAVLQGVIEPLSLIGEVYDARFLNFSWPTLFSLMQGGSTGVANYPEAFILIKPKGYVIEGVSFNSNVAPSIVYAHFSVEEFYNFDISLSLGK